MLNQQYKNGFTLLEILIVLAIIALFGTIMMPNLQRPRYEREEFIARLNAATRSAQQQAMTTHTLQQIFFDMKQRQVSIKSEEKTQAKKKEKTFKASSIASFTWPAHIEIRQFLIDGKDALQAFALKGTAQAWFFITPQGYAQEVTINVIDKKDTIDGKPRRVGLVLNPFNAQFKVYDSFQK